MAYALALLSAKTISLRWHVIKNCINSWLIDVLILQHQNARVRVSWVLAHKNWNDFLSSRLSALFARKMCSQQQSELSCQISRWFCSALIRIRQIQTQTLAHSAKHPAVCFPGIRLSPNNNEKEQNKTAHWGERERLSIKENFYSVYICHRFAPLALKQWNLRHWGEQEVCSSIGATICHHQKVWRQIFLRLSAFVLRNVISGTCQLCQQLKIWGWRCTQIDNI